MSGMWSRHSDGSPARPTGTTLLREKPAWFAVVLQVQEGRNRVVGDEVGQVTKMRGHIAAHKTCSVHGDNGCELQGETGSKTREQEKRELKKELSEELQESVSHL